MGVLGSKQLDYWVSTRVVKFKVTVQFTATVSQCDGIKVCDIFIYVT